MILMVVASEKTTTTTEREGSPQSILRKENTTREGDLQSVPRNDIPIRGEEALRIILEEETIPDHEILDISYRYVL